MLQQDLYDSGTPLTREGLFQLVTDEALRDGRVDALDKKILQTLLGFLRFDPCLAADIARFSHIKFQAGELGPQRRFQPIQLYKRVLKYAHFDAGAGKLELQMLVGIRKLFGIDEASHQEALAHVRSNPNATQNIVVRERPVSSPRPTRRESAISFPIRRTLKERSLSGATRKEPVPAIEVSAQASAEPVSTLESPRTTRKEPVLKCVSPRPTRKELAFTAEAPSTSASTPRISRAQAPATSPRSTVSSKQSPVLRAQAVGGVGGRVSLGSRGTRPVTAAEVASRSSLTQMIRTRAESLPTSARIAILSFMMVSTCASAFCLYMLYFA